MYTQIHLLSFKLLFLYSSGWYRYGFTKEVLNKYKVGSSHANLHLLIAAFLGSSKSKLMWLPSLMPSQESSI